VFKITDDPRVTRVGRLIRRLHLDELPQLVNVVRGEMSLVGPRPLPLVEDRRIEGWHRRRLDLRPGITGPWQVLGSAKLPVREMVRLPVRRGLVAVERHPHPAAGPRPHRPRPPRLSGGVRPAYIRSGALTPSSSSVVAIVRIVATQTPSRAASVAGSAPTTRQSR
jgi:hypothetical protein